MGEARNQTPDRQAIRRVIKNGSGTLEEVVHYHLLYEGVPKELEKYAETELKETPEKARRGIQKLKKFLQDKKMPDVDDHIIIAILRKCKYDLQKSVVTLEKFLKSRNTIIQQLAELDLKKVEHILDDNIFAFLPYRDKLGRMILYSQAPMNFDFYSVEDVLVCFYASIFYLMKFPLTSLFGMVLISECKISSISLLYPIFTVLKKTLDTWFNTPMRVRRIDVLDENFLIKWFFNILRPLVPAKLYKKTFFHGENLKDLQEFYHPDIIPEECGGNMGPLSTKFYREELMNFITELKAEHQRKTAAKE